MSDQDQPKKRKPIIHIIPAKRNMQKRKRVALYCRVSTELELQRNSLSAQMDFQKQEILENRDWEYIGTYTDTKSGRSIKDRPGFQKMLEACEAGEIDLIYTKSVSRFGRNCVDFLVTVRRLKELKVDVYFQNECMYLHSKQAEFLLSLHSMWAESESVNKSEDVKWGIRRSTMNPNSPAFSRRCFGYDKDKKGNLVINQEQANVVKRIFDLFGQGYSIIKIKKDLETQRMPSPTGKRRWAVKTIENILTNEKYTGTSVYGSTVSHDYPSTKRSSRKSEDIHRSENHHPAIIDQIRFDQIQKLKAERSNVEVDGAGNRVRKPTHYSMKNPKKAPKIIKKPFNDKPQNLTK